MIFNRKLFYQGYQLTKMKRQSSQPHHNDQIQTNMQSHSANNEQFEVTSLEYKQQQPMKFEKHAEYFCVDMRCEEKNRIFSSKSNDKEKQQINLAHYHHERIEKNTLLKRLKVLKCNEKCEKHEILQELQKISSKVQQFQRDIMQKIHLLKYSLKNHLNIIKKSFDQEHFQYCQNLLKKEYNFSTIHFCLVEIEKFESIKFPNLHYPLKKINLMNSYLDNLTNKCKSRIMDEIDEWSNSLLYKHEANKQIRRYNSIQSFMELGLSEENIFSTFLKNKSLLTNESCKNLKRDEQSQEHIGEIVIVEHKLVNNVEVKLKMKKIDRAITIGVADLDLIREKSFKNCYKIGYFMNTKGKLIPKDMWEHINCIPFKINQGEIVSIKRQDDSFIFSQDSSKNQQVRFTISNEEIKRDNMYVCVGLEGKCSEVQIIN